MKKIFVAVIAVLSFSLALVGTSSAVTLTGSPALVARAEAWQAKSAVPLGNETVELVPIAGFCPAGAADGGCSQMPQYGAATAATSIGAFYFELGHQLDWSTLTPANRRFLARKWGDPHWHWFDSAASVAAGYEDGLESMFAMMVESCAFGHPEFHTSIAESMPVQPDAETTQVPTINPGSFDTCTWLKRVAA